MFDRVPTVDVEEAQRMLAGGAVLLDVRRDDEWQAGHAPGAVHIPLDQVPGRASEVPQDQQTVAICRSGARSGQATQYLRRFGVDVVNLDGGMQAWQRAGAQVVRDDGSPGHVA